MRHSRPTPSATRDHLGALRPRAGWISALLLTLLAAAAARADDDEGAKPPPEPLLLPGALDTREPLERRLLVPPVLLEKRGDVNTRAVFPFYFEREAPHDHQRFVLPYFWERGEELNVDVAGGLFWWLRGPERNTVVIPPVYTHRDGDNRTHGLPPLFLARRSPEARYTVLPPLLTYARRDEDSLLQIAGPLWRSHDRRDKWYGFAPLVYGKRGILDSLFVLAPIYWRFTDDDGKQRTNLVPPFYYTVRDEIRGWGLPPLFSRKTGPNLRKTTVPVAMFHLGHVGEQLKLVTPLFAYLENEEEEGYLAVSPLFQWKRGIKGNANAIAPLFFQTWDDRDKSHGLVISPLFWHFDDPANDTLIIAPFMGRRYRTGLSRAWWFPLAGRKVSFEEEAGTWWIAPTFHYDYTPDSRSFNIHPLWYFLRSPQKTHFALAPLYFDFRDKKKQTVKRIAAPLYFDFRKEAKGKHGRVFFPLYWDLGDKRKGSRSRVFFPLYYDIERERKDRRTRVGFPFYVQMDQGDTTHRVVLNSYHRSEPSVGGDKWRYYFNPLFSVGRSPQGKVWDVLYGLAGYERRGKHRRMKLFWIPFSLRSKGGGSTAAGE